MWLGWRFENKANLRELRQLLTLNQHVHQSKNLCGVFLIDNYVWVHPQRSHQLSSEYDHILAYQPIRQCNWSNIPISSIRSSPVNTLFLLLLLNPFLVDALVIVNSIPFKKLFLPACLPPFSQSQIGQQHICIRNSIIHELRPPT